MCYPPLLHLHLADSLLLVLVSCASSFHFCVISLLLVYTWNTVLLPCTSSLHVGYLWTCRSSELKQHLAQPGLLNPIAAQHFAKSQSKIFHDDSLEWCLNLSRSKMCFFKEEVFWNCPECDANLELQEKKWNELDVTLLKVGGFDNLIRPIATTVLTLHCKLLGRPVQATKSLGQLEGREGAKMVIN